MTLHIAAKISKNKEGDYWLKSPTFNLNEPLGATDLEDMIDEARELIEKSARDSKISLPYVNYPDIVVSLKFKVEGQKDRKISEFQDSADAGVDAE